MQKKIERLVQQLSNLQLQQAAVIEELQTLGNASTAGVRSSTLDNIKNEDANANSGDDPIVHCYDRYNKRISIHDRVYLITKGKFKIRVGKVTKIDSKSKWITIELDSTRQITRRKSNNIRLEPIR